jgi:hypothetical protein
MLSIKRLIYSLKKRFGQPMDFYREIDSEPNIQTGIIAQNRIKYHIEKGVFLDQIVEIRNPLTKILGQLAGVIDTFEVAILLDGSDFPKKFKPHLKDYVIIEHQRYEIKSVQEVDDRQSLYITLEEYKGSVTYEQKDIRVKDKLNIIQILNYVKSHKYIEDIVDELPLNQSVEAYDKFHQYLSDAIDFVDGVEVNQKYMNTILQILNDKLDFTTTISTNIKSIHLIDELKLVENLSITIPPILNP